MDNKLKIVGIVSFIIVVLVYILIRGGFLGNMGYSWFIIILVVQIIALIIFAYYRNISKNEIRQKDKEHVENIWKR